MRAREINRRIERLGGVMVGQRGSHRKYRATGGDPPITAHAIVPQHGGDVPQGTLHSIEKALAPVFGEGWLR